VRVLVADDHPLFRLGLTLGLQAEGFTVVGDVENGRTAVERCAAGDIDIALLDVRMPELDGIEACRRIVARPGAPTVVILTTFDEPAMIAAAREAGATAYLSKETTPKELARLLRQILGQPDRDWMPRVRLPELTQRESEVLVLMAAGLTTPAIAGQLGISPETAKDHLQNVYRKLDVRDRVSAVRRAEELGLV